MQRLLLLLFIISTAFAEDFFSGALPADRSWVTEQEEFLIGGLINPATGAISLNETDLIADGVEPLFLSRYYVPPEPMLFHNPLSGAAPAQIRSGWIFFPHVHAVYQKNLFSANRLYLWEPDGSMLAFEEKRDGSFILKSKGPFLNSNGRDVSGTFDGRNTTFSLNKSSLIIQSKDGTTRYYKLTKKEEGVNYFYLQKERLPNGRGVVYSYDSNYALVKVQSIDPTGKFAYASLRREGNTWVTHTGQKATYSFDIRPGNTIQSIHCILTHVSSPSVHRKYIYTNRGDLIGQEKLHPIFSLSYTPLHKVESIHLPVGMEGEKFATHVIHYDGKKTTVIHADNTKTDYEMDKKTHSYRICHEGKQQNVLFSPEGHLRQISIRNLYQKNYECDRFGSPIREVLVGNLSGKGREETYNIRREYDRHRLLKEVTDSGLTTKYSYLHDTNLVTSKILQGKDGLHLEEHYVYDEYHNLIESTIMGCTTRYILRQSHPHLHKVDWIETSEKKVHLHYDRHGNVSKEDHYDADDVYAFSISKTYNARGQVTSETNALGEVTTHNFDQDGRLLSSSRPKKEFKYDKRGRMLRSADALYQTDYQYDASDNLVRMTNRFGTTEYEYRDQKQIRHIQGIKVTTSNYDVYGREISRTDGNGYTTFTEYNARNQPTVITHPTGTQEFFLYYLDGKLKQHIDPEGNAIVYEYDTFNRITKKIYEGIGEETFEYDAIVLLSHTDLEGHTIHYFYDDLHRKIKEERCGRVIEYSYDSLGRIASRIQGGISTEFKYDPLSRMTFQQTPHSNIKYTYDEDGNQSSITSGESKDEFGYDPLSRQIWKKNPIGNLTRTEYIDLEKRISDPHGITTIETWDQHENVIAREIPNVTAFRYQYDLEGNLIREEEDVYKNGTYLKTLISTYTYTPKNEIASITRYGKTTKYTYTPSGKISTKTQPDGTVIEYCYDKLGYLTRVGSEIFTYNKLGHLIGGTGFTRVIDPFGNVLKETFANGLVIEKTYDDLDRPLTVTLPTGTICYSYDLRLISISYKGYTHNYTYNQTGHILSSGTASFERDLAGQIIQIKSPHMYQECRYDSRGNLTNVASKTYEYDELSQLAGEFDSHFDAHDAPLTGNLKEHKGYTLIYDPHDRLTQAGSNHFTYDSLGRRLSKNNEVYLYDGLTEIATLRDGKYYVKINDVLLDLDGMLAVPLFDGTYQIRYIIDPFSHEIINTYEFDPFGNPIRIVEKVFNPYRYASKHYDEETGLIYFGKRYYDPSRKRWITPDPAGPIDGANLYAFVRNNPFRYHDYFGLFASFREVNLRSTMQGIYHGAMDFSLNCLHDLQLGAAYLGAPDWDMSLEDRMRMMESVSASHIRQRARIDGWVRSTLSIDASDEVYQSFRSGTTRGLEIGSLLFGGYGVVRGRAGFSMFSKIPVQTSKLVKTNDIINASKSNKIWTSTKKRTSVENAFRHWKDHGSEFPKLSNAKQYVEQSRSFFAEREKLLMKIRPNGEIIIYDIETNVFGVFTNEGVPKTMFKPKDGILYYRRN